jgi:hypothetical protein
VKAKWFCSDVGKGEEQQSFGLAGLELCQALTKKATRQARDTCGKQSGVRYHQLSGRIYFMCGSQKGHKLGRIKRTMGQAPVVHACNPSYSGSRDQEVVQSQPGQIVRETLSQKTLHGNRAGGVA